VNETDDHERQLVGGDGGGATDDNSLETLVFRTCVTALWADGVMASAERDYLSHLIDAVSLEEAEREQLRRLALHDVDRHGLLAEIDELPETTKRDLFDRTVALLTSDRRVRRSELRFLGELRRHCGIGFWSFQRLLWRVTRIRRWVAVLALLVVVAVAVGIIRGRASQPETVAPPELANFVAIAIPQLPADRPELDAEALFERVRISVVRVNVDIDGADHGQGSGSIIGVDRFGQLYVLTNRHVVVHELREEQRISYEVELESGVRLPAALDFYSREDDLALVMVPNLTGWGRPVPLLSRDQLHVGQRVFAVGSPIGLAHTFTSGVISALRAEHIQTDATVHMGSSGGPLFDATGMVCGVVTMTHQHKDFSFAVYADAVFDMLTERFVVKTGESAGGDSPELPADASP
jgi:hypothetical protein